MAALVPLFTERLRKEQIEPLLPRWHEPRGTEDDGPKAPLRNRWCPPEPAR